MGLTLLRPGLHDIFSLYLNLGVQLFLFLAVLLGQRVSFLYWQRGFLHDGWILLFFEFLHGVYLHRLRSV